MGQRACKVSPMIGEVYDQHLSTPPKPSINTAVQHPHPRDETPVDAGEGNSQERRVMERGGEEGGEEEEVEELRVMERGEESGGGEEVDEELRRVMEEEEVDEELRRVMERVEESEGGKEEEEVDEELRRVMERVEESGGGEEEEEVDEELRRVMEEEEVDEELRRVMERVEESEGGEERKESGRVQEKRKNKKWWRKRLSSFFRGESGEGGGEKEERRVMERGGEEEEERKEWWRRLPSFFRAGRKQPPESSSGQGEEKQPQKRKVAWAGRSSDDYIFSRYSVGDELGKGGFGVVYEGRRLEDDLKVALKYVTKTQGMKCLFIPDHPKPLPIEIALTILANQGPSVPEVIRLLDWQDRPDHFVMVLECPSPCENLGQFMKRHGGRLDEEKARYIMKQTAHAANVCCLRGVLHHDIKLANLLINSKTSEVKLIDFGCGGMLRSSPYRSYFGTAAYSPPEYHVRGKYYGRQATAWSLGILMFVMLCGHFPRNHDLLLLKQKRWSKPGLSTECCHLLRALLQDNPSRRLAMGLILSHNWFKVVT